MAQKVDMQEIRERYRRSQEDMQNRANAVPWLKVPVGRTILRVMPPWADGVPTFYREQWSHHIANKDDPTKTIGVTCPRKEAQQSCPICDIVKALFATGDKTDEALAKAMNVGRRVLVNAVDLTDPQRASKGVQVWGVPARTFDEQVLPMIADPDEGVDFTDPETGFNVIVDRTGTTKTDTRYRVTRKQQPSPVSTPAWLDGLHNLDNLIVLKESDEIRALLPPDTVRLLPPPASSQDEGDVPPDTSEAATPPCFETYSSGDPTCDGATGKPSPYAKRGEMACRHKSACVKACLASMGPNAPAAQVQALRAALRGDTSGGGK